MKSLGLAKTVAIIFAIGITTLISSVTVAAPYFAKAQINLADLTSAKELALILPDLSQGITLDGITDSRSVSLCQYVSKIRNSYVENEVYHIEIDFSFRGNTKACGDAIGGSNALWEILASNPKVKMGPIEKDLGAVSLAVSVR